MKVAVIGAGISGLSVGQKLAERGLEVFLVEKENHLGGLCQSIKKDGLTFDLGPHNIHTSNPEIIDELKVLLDGDLLTNKAKSQIYFRDKFVDYPFKGLSVFTSIDPLTAVLCGLDFARTRLQLRLNPGLNGYNYESWVTERFGRKLYNIYFGPYTEKVWGVHPSQLSPIFAKKRIAVLSLFDLVKRYVLGMKGRYHSEDPDHVGSYYPRYGIGQLIDILAAQMAEERARILSGHEVIAVEADGNKINALVLRDAAVERRLEADFFINTMPLTELIKRMKPSAPREILEIANQLRYRSMIFQYLVVRNRDVFRTPWVYFSDASFPFNRAYELAKFSPDVVSDGLNGLCFEISCFEGDTLWESDDHDIFLSVVQPMVRNGFIRESEIVDGFTVRREFVYPVFTMHYERQLKELIRYLGRFKNIVTFGRQGLFTYVNVDNCMEMGDELAHWLVGQASASRRTLFSPYVPDSSVWY